MAVVPDPLKALEAWGRQRGPGRVADLGAVLQWKLESSKAESIGLDPSSPQQQQENVPNP